MLKQQMHKELAEKLAEAEHALSAATAGQFAHLYTVETVARLERKLAALQKKVAKAA